MYVLDYWRRTDVAFDMAESAAAAPNDAGPPASKEPSRVRVEFPETWLWSDSVTGYRLA